MKKTLNLFLIIFLSLLINGCKRYSEIHEISFVLSIGLDYDQENEMFEVSVYVINNANLTQSDNQSIDTSSYIGVYKSKSLTEALKKITSNVDVTLELKHVKTIFINEHFLTFDNREYFYTFFKNGPLLYPSFEIYITPNKIKDLFNVQVFEETTLYYTILTGTKKAHNHKPVTFYQFVNDKLIPNYFLGYPVITVSSDIFQDGENEFKKTENTGIMFFDEYANKHFLEYEDFPGMYLIHDFNNLLLKLDGIEILIDNYKFEYIVDKNNSIKFDIDLEVNYIYSKEYNMFDYQNQLKESIKKEIIKLYQECLHQEIDIFNINYLRSIKKLNEIDLNNVDFIFDINIDTP